MQKLEIFSLFDRKSASYGMPFYAPHRNVALRMVKTAVNGQAGNVDLANYPEDFALYSLGVFSDSDGRISPTVPEFIINCIELKVMPQASREGCRGETSPSARGATENAVFDAPDESTVVLPVPSVDTALGAPAKQESPITDER